ncbi:AraC family transcriptional regulator [Bacillus sp. FJAT-49732]|uniref:AraC family transcriptional regulator n=1 Tax=Lederbergia citrisecunda TaxID=2833583 RepID=A0A942TLN3_9BACI|nr:AraC family transcriptional regulator [Lederbergia citrisecunda]MBS4200445.1 AraC family transcriptional regulator [Lederbergia citrisecunda]
MKPLTKSIESDFIHIVFQDTKQPDHELPDHVHDWHEIVYVYGGTGTFFINQHFYEMSKGDIFVLPANTIHRAVPDSKNPITSTALFFHPSIIAQSSFIRSLSIGGIIDKSKKDQEYRYSLATNKNNKVENFLMEIEKEYRYKRVDSWEAIVLLLHLLLLELNRHCLKQNERMGNHEPDWLKNSLIYIDKHLGEKLDLKTIAKTVSVSPAHLSREFKGFIGMNITDYITTKRIIWAKEMLLSTNDPIHSIAHQCGYQSMPHFHRTFKSITGKTPKEYRFNIQY